MEIFHLINSYYRTLSFGLSHKATVLTLQAGPYINSPLEGKLGEDRQAMFM